MQSRSVCSARACHVCIGLSETATSHSRLPCGSAAAGPELVKVTWCTVPGHALNATASLAWDATLLRAGLRAPAVHAGLQLEGHNLQGTPGVT